MPAPASSLPSLIQPGTDIPEPRQDSVDLVFASDDNYIRYTAVTLASILANYKGQAPLRVFVMLGGPLSAGDREKLEALRGIHAFELYEIVADAGLFSTIRTTPGISIATYYRLLAHRLLPPNTHKALYLDSDLVVLGSIDELFSTPFNGALFAGVEDSISRDRNLKFGLPENAVHPNAGVLLINLDLMRAIRFDDRLEQYLDVNRYRITLGDQQIVTEMFQGLIKYVAPKWNVHGPMFSAKWAWSGAGTRNTMDRSEALEAIRNPAIIHYTLSRKPWMSRVHSRWRAWYEYLALTQYRGEIPVPPENLGESVVRTTRRVLRWPGFSLVMRPLLTKYPDLPKRLVKAGRYARRMVRNAPFAGAADPEIGPAFKLKTILRSRSAALPDHFSAREMIGSLKENALIKSNISVEDLTGGYMENLKTALRTAQIGNPPPAFPDAVLIGVQRIRDEDFWDCIMASYLYDLPLYFVEVNFFGAFASYFDPEVAAKERRAFGFILDDMGHYFDARQPSRVETTLNSEGFKLKAAEKRRVGALIERVKSEHLTKYNKYAGATTRNFAAGGILVVDQKPGDASLEFAAADAYSFERMLKAAVAENEGVPVYVKVHPDNLYGKKKLNPVFDISGVEIVSGEVPIWVLLEACDKVYTISSQVGFEALLYGKQVVTFGMPFYAGWGLTDDRVPVRRRTRKRSIEDVFHVTCIEQSVYLDPDTGQHIEIEAAFDMIMRLREAHAALKRPG